MRRIRISSAIRKIKGKWYARKKRAMNRFLSCSLYQQFSEICLDRCSEYIMILKEKFDALWDQKIEQLKSCLAKETLVNNKLNSLINLIKMTINSLLIREQKLHNIASLIWNTECGATRREIPMRETFSSRQGFFTTNIDILMIVEMKTINELIQTCNDERYMIIVTSSWMNFEYTYFIPPQSSCLCLIIYSIDALVNNSTILILWITCFVSWLTPFLS